MSDFVDEEQSASVSSGRRMSNCSSEGAAGIAIWLIGASDAAAPEVQ